MVVLKFGGTSVANSENIKKVKDILIVQNDNLLVVVSAFSGVTNALQDIANQSLNDNSFKKIEEIKYLHFQVANELLVSIPSELEFFLNESFSEIEKLCIGINALQELSNRTMAKIMSFGERLSSKIIGTYLKNHLEISIEKSEKLIKVSDNYLNANLLENETNFNINSVINTNKNYIVGGFVASNSQNEICLLGRGGSDYTAAIYGVALQVKQVEIWSDVNGMLEANPKIVTKANSILNMAYDEALELSHFGAKVLYPKTVKPLKNAQIPIYLKNTFEPNFEGTLISDIEHKDNQSLKGVTSLDNISLISIFGEALSGNKGMAKRVFEAFECVNIILITQSSSEQDICVAINSSEVELAKASYEKVFERELLLQTMEHLKIESDFSILALIGNNMKHNVGFSGKCFKVLGENNINIAAISQGSTERNISIVVKSKDENKALNVLHEKFFLNTTKKIHIFIAGYGNVGKEFINIIKSQQAKLIEKYTLELKIIGISNSSSMCWNENGIDLDKELTFQKFNHFEDFVDKAVTLNLRNSVFIDNTASEVVSNYYQKFLENAISVVACNKIACASEFSNYQKLNATAIQKNVQFKYETCVGAALPIIKTFQHLILSGDKINEIKACLSGSLNFIFNNYNGTVPFAEIVKQAQTEGYTEPNPLIDLSGLDVRRKILILARESGYSLEMDEVSSVSFLPQSCTDAPSVEKLYEEMYHHETHFKKLYDQANVKGNKLKVVASFQNQKAQVGLEEISPESPFFHLEGKDNIVSILSERYPLQPMVIKGAGAGAMVTASGVFSDLMLIINK
jgi:bifunctional aspartokinase / homoserine dehydrogenase 1